jgi:hypothetical protein
VIHTLPVSLYMILEGDILKGSNTDKMETIKGDYMTPI